MKPRILSLFVTLPLAAISYSHAQTTHTFTALGSTSSAGTPVVVAHNWGDSANWDVNGIPNSATSTALFSPASGGYTVRFVAADGTTPVVSDVNVLRYAGTPGAATTFHNIGGAGGINLTGTNPTVDNQSAAQSVFYYANITGSNGLTKTGPGRFTLRFNGIDQPYTGTVKINEGTFGIEKDRSLGNVNNAIEIANLAKLLAEPGSNSGTVTLPATRSITLTGLLPQIGSSNVNINLVIESPIGDGGNGYGINKTDAGVVTLAGTNSWTGAVALTAGVLSATKPEALPGYDSQPYNVTGTSTLAVRYGDASTWTDTQIGDLIGNVVFDDPSSFGLDTTANTLDATFAGDLANDLGVTRFTKVGPGKLTLSSAPDLTRITVFEGTLALGSTSTPAADVALLFTKSGGILDLGTTTASAASLAHVNGGTTTITNGTLTMPATYSFAPTAANTVLALPTTTATFGRVQPFGGGLTTIDGAGGSLTVNGDFNFDVNSTQNTRLVMSGLSTFTYNRSNRAFRCLPATAATDTTVHELVLANSTNTVTANLVQVGGASGSSQGNAHQGQMRLGTTNEFRTPTFQIGAFNGSGVVTYQAGLTTPTFKLRGTDGTSAATTLTVGETTSGVRSGAGTLDLAGGSADISVGTVFVGRHAAGSNNGNTSAFTIPNGTVTADSIIVGDKTFGGTPATVGVVNQQGAASVTATSLTLGHAGFQTAATGQVLQGTFNLDGGTLAATSVNGFNQVESAAAAGTITTAGNLAVTVTSADLVSPVTVNVPVAAGDVTTGTGGNSWTQKVFNALNGNATITAKFVVHRADTAIGLTRRTGGSIDATLNIALANGTAAGITEVVTSTDAVVSRNTSTGIGRNLILRGGTLINKTGADLTISGVTMLAAGNTTTVVDSTEGQKVVLAADATYSARMNSAAETAGKLTVDGDLDLTASPAFFIFDDATTAAKLDPGTKLTLIDYTDGSISGTFAGLPDGATVEVTKGAVTNTFVIDYDDLGGTAVTLTVSSGFAGWITGTFANDATVPGGQQGPNDDPDGDGISNLLEYALAGLDPTVANGAAGTLTGLTLSFAKRQPLATDITYAIETSDDLGVSDAWTEADPDVNDDTTISYTLQDPGENFARLKVSQN